MRRSQMPRFDDLSPKERKAAELRAVLGFAVGRNWQGGSTLVDPSEAIHAVMHLARKHGVIDPRNRTIYPEKMRAVVVPKEDSAQLQAVAPKVSKPRARLVERDSPAAKSAQASNRVERTEPVAISREKVAAIETEYVWVKEDKSPCPHCNKNYGQVHAPDCRRMK
jgi:hypothetical protein